jgi:flagellar hook-basal body complex protein FliE
MDFRVGATEDYRMTPAVPQISGLKELTSPVKPEGISPFSSFFNAAVELFNETNQFQLTAEQLQTDLATGQTDDILTVLLAQDRAYNALNFTVQVTNKIIESYREIMRMQV